MFLHILLWLFTCCTIIRRISLGIVLLLSWKCAVKQWTCAVGMTYWILWCCRWYFERNLGLFGCEWAASLQSRVASMWAGWSVPAAAVTCMHEQRAWVHYCVPAATAQSQQQWGCGKSLFLNAFGMRFCATTWTTVYHNLNILVSTHRILHACKQWRLLTKHILQVGTEWIKWQCACLCKQLSLGYNHQPPARLEGKLTCATSADENLVRRDKLAMPMNEVKGFMYRHYFSRVSHNSMLFSSVLDGCIDGIS